MTVNMTTPFVPGEKAPSTVDYSKLLGERFLHRLANGNQILLRLFQLDLVAGVAAPEKLTFIRTSPNAAFDGQVKPCTAQTDRPQCVALVGQVALDDNDYFLGQVLGEATVLKGDDASNVTAGDYIQCDNDADTGKVFTNTTTTTRALTIGQAKAATTTTDEDLVIEIRDELLG